MMPVAVWGKRILFGVLAGALLAVSSAQALVFRDTGGHWPQETSDVAPDSAVRYGYLKNGIRWALLPGKEGEKGGKEREEKERGERKRERKREEEAKTGEEVERITGCDFFPSRPDDIENSGEREKGKF